jgi:SAM-dependent methyltransferase
MIDASYWDAKFDVDEFIYTKEVNRFVKEYCEPLIQEIGSIGKVIDLAGGEGRNSVWFAEHGWQAENIDFSGKALTKFLAFAEERGVGEKCFANRADATGFESVLMPVDIGVCAYLQIPQPDLADALDNLIENIKPGGYLMGVWHARENLDGGFGGPQDPAVLPTASEIREFLSAYPVEIQFLGNRDGQVQTRDGLKPSTTLVLLAQLNKQ